MSHLIPPIRFKVESFEYATQAESDDRVGFAVLDRKYDNEIVQTVSGRAEAEAYARGRDAEETLVEDVELALDLVRRIDMVMSQNHLGAMSAADVTAALYSMGFGNMTRGEVLKGGGYA